MINKKVIVVFLMFSIANFGLFNEINVKGSEDTIHIEGYNIREGIGADVYTDGDEIFIDYLHNPPITYFGKFSGGEISNEVKIGPIYPDASLQKFKGTNYLFYFNRTEDTIRVLINNTVEEDIITDNYAFVFDAIVYNNKIHVYFILGESSSKNGINLITFDGESWSGPKCITNKPTFVYSIETEVYNNKLHLFYVGFNSSEGGRSVYAMQSQDGTKWSDPLWLSQGADSQALRDVIVHNDHLYCFWSSQNKDILEGKRYDSNSWSEANTLKFKSSGEPLISSQVEVELLNDKLYCFAWPNDGKRDDLIVGEFDDWKIDSTVISLKDLNNNPPTVVHNNSIWIFYDDGEYIRYITYDGENFDYAELIEEEANVAEIIIHYWWMIAVVGIVVVLLGLFKHKGGNQEVEIREDFDRDEYFDGRI